MDLIAKRKFKKEKERIKKLEKKVKAYNYIFKR